MPKQQDGGRLVYWILGALLTINMTLMGIVSSLAFNSITKNEDAIVAAKDTMMQIEVRLGQMQMMDSLLISDMRECQIKWKESETP